jgi:Leucine-rich repeat (LRR) protein
MRDWPISQRWLDLEQTQISDEGMQHLPKLTKLNQLGVSDSKVTDKGLEMLHKLSNFVYLNVELTRVSIEERARLRELFPKCTIRPNP